MRTRIVAATVVATLAAVIGTSTSGFGARDAREVAISRAPVTLPFANATSTSSTSTTSTTLPPTTSTTSTTTSSTTSTTTSSSTTSTTTPLDCTEGTIAVGDRPLTIAMNPAGTIAYVGNFAGSSVSVIDTSDNSVTATYMLRGGVGELALNPSGTELYVGSPDSTLITVLDTSDGSVVGSVIAGNGIVSMAFSPDGTRLYVANSTDGSISVVDTSTLSVLTTVTFSFGVTVSPFSLVADASYLYVGLAEGVILVLDRVTNTLLEGAPLPVDQYPKDMFFDSSGRLYVSTVYDDFIYVLDVSTPAELVIDQEIEMPNDIMGMALNPAGTLLYVTMNTSDEVKVIDVSDYSIVDTFATAVNPYDIAFSSSTGGAYVVSQDEDSVEVFC